MVIWEFSGAESDVNAITFKMNDYRHSLGITSSNGVVMPTVDGVVDGYVGSCVQNLGAGGSDYTAGTGYSNLVGTGAAGYAAGAGKTTSAAGPQTPTFTSNDSAGEHYGVSFVIQPPFTMPTGPFNPPTKGETFSLSVGLASISNPGSFQINPTISLGDFKVSKDGGALANLATQPIVRPAGSQSVILSLSSTEMDADVVTIVGIDQTGPKEGEDLEISIPTTGA